MLSCMDTGPVEGEMAVTTHEDALRQEQTLRPSQSLDVTKLVIWIAAAVLPWTAIIAGARLLISAFG
jgi:hypothetical protein